MLQRRSIQLPTTVRIKPGALDRVGIYLQRAECRQVAVMRSEGLPPELPGRLVAGCDGAGVGIAWSGEVDGAAFESIGGLLEALPAACDAVVGLGGGKALDVARYVAHLAGRPFFAVPTSLSNDGFCSPQASLTLGGRRHSLPAVLPQAVVVDTAVCLAAPEVLWWAGVGDLVAKTTAIADWKLAFHARGTPVDDLAALLSDATVYQFMARPVRDEQGVRLLATSLMLNGIAMAICGSSRPASGSEHLISHALDRVARRPRLHGLQVGVASYLVSRLQGQGSERIDAVLTATGFWDGVAADPFDRAEWLAAARLAPTLKDDFHTVLAERDCLPEIEDLLAGDARLAACIVDHP
jgi:glycerol-1-phosphate dehydrogenase [NAD(P)+]